MLENRGKAFQLSVTALFAAIVCIGTILIRIPIPATNGYIHLGDAFVILSGLFLGPVYGAAAAGIGAALADLIGGYVLYAPVTLVVKICMAVGAWVICHKLVKEQINIFIRCVLAGIFATLINVAGYLGYEFVIYGMTAFLSVPANFVQGISGLIISSYLYPVLKKRLAGQNK